MSNSASEASNAQTIATLLQEEGCRAKIETDDVIRSGTSGFRISLYLYRESIQLRLGLEIEGSYVQLRHVNEFNSKYRFAKAYLDDDGDIVLESEFLFDFAAEKAEAAATLRKIIAIFDGSIFSLRKTIDQAEEEATAGSAIPEEESPKSAPESAESLTDEIAVTDRSEE